MELTNITVNFEERTGRKIKPMHAIGQPPAYAGKEGVGAGLFHYMEEAAIPYSRLHDFRYPFGGHHYVDVPNIFPDFDADADDPASYDFTFTDLLLEKLNWYHMEPFYRLGISIENAANIKAYHVFPPKDFQKWAVICEHIIRHYNEGWADGFHYGIRYWEIWNEPDVDFDPENTAQTWHGSREEFFLLYETASKHLKKCFGDSIAVGGYAAIGFKEHEIWDPDFTGVDPQNANKHHPWAYRIDYAYKFLAYVREHGCPLDFFSWHAYTAEVSDYVDRAKYCRALLDKFGFHNVPDILNEWNTCFRKKKECSSEITAARDFGVMLAMQRSATDMLCFYDAGIGRSVYSGMINPENMEPYRCYYAFKAFGHAYRLGEEVFSDSSDGEIYVLGARNTENGVLLIANTKDTPVTLSLQASGAASDSGEVIITDEEYLYTMVGEVIEDGKLTVKPYSCVEVRYELA